MAKPATSKTRDQALLWLAEGVSASEVARRVGRAVSTVTRWQRAADRAGRVVKSRAPEIPAEPAADEDNASTLDMLRRMLADTTRRIRMAEAQGNLTAAQKMARDAGGLANTIARLERLESADADVVTITREQLHDAQSSVRARIRALADRPLLCSQCSRALSVQWGQSARKDGSE